PTTEQILADCAREVRETLMPAVDGTMRVTLEMLEQILAQCALRSGHELQWMAEEAAAIEPFVADVVASLGDEATTGALAALRAGAPGSLDLDAHCARYHLAGEALSCALEAALAADDRDLT